MPKNAPKNGPNNVCRRIFKRLKRTLYLLSSIYLCQLPAIAQAEISRNDTSTNAALTFGFLPMQSPIALFKRFAPLRDYLSTELHREIRLETAKNFPEYAKRTTNRHYDILLTAPHMALSALEEGQYELAATFDQPLQAVIITHANSHIEQPAQLTGKIIATPPQQAIVTLFGIKYLQTQNVTNTQFKTYRTHNAAYRAVLGNEAQAAIIANFIAINAIKQQQPLKIIAQSPSFPGVGVLVAKDLSLDLKNRIKKTLWEMASQPKGKIILKKISQPGYIQAHPAEFEALRPFMPAKITQHKVQKNAQKTAPQQPLKISPPIK